jgi:hypothetical protein
MGIHVSPSSAISTAVPVKPVSRRSTKTVTKLYAELDLAHAAYLAACATRDFDDNAAARDNLDRTLVSPALSKFTAIGERLLHADATSLQEMLLQIRVTVALNGAPLNSLTELDGFDDFENLDGDALLTLKHLRESLMRLSRSRRS